MVLWHTLLSKVGLILDLSFDIDTGQKTSDSILIFLIAVCSLMHLTLVTTMTFSKKFLISLHSVPLFCPTCNIQVMLPKAICLLTLY